MADAPTFPCATCGVLRTKAQGGTIFTICDTCWDQHTKQAVAEARIAEICKEVTGTDDPA